MQTVSKKIKQKIKNGGRGRLYFNSDFSKYGDSKTISRILMQLSKSVFIIRILRVVYYYPTINKLFGIGFCGLENVAKEIAKRKNICLAQTAWYAQNALGLSTQVPMNVVYMTDGSPRKVKIGKRKITFKKTSPRNFEYKGKIIPLVVGALKEIGEDHIDAEQLRQLERVLLHSEEKKILLNDANLAPTWIKKVILPIINKLDE